MTCLYRYLGFLAGYKTSIDAVQGSGIRVEQTLASTAYYCSTIRRSDDSAL